MLSPIMEQNFPVRKKFVFLNEKSSLVSKPADSRGTIKIYFGKEEWRWKKERT